MLSSLQRLRAASRHDVYERQEGREMMLAGLAWEAGQCKRTSYWRKGIESQWSWFPQPLLRLLKLPKKKKVSGDNNLECAAVFNMLQMAAGMADAVSIPDIYLMQMATFMADAVSSPEAYLMVDRATGSRPGQDGTSLPKSLYDMPLPTNQESPTPHNLPVQEMAAGMQMAAGMADAVSSPDVYLMVDRATGSCPGQDGSSLPKSSWSTVKDLVLLPGGFKVVVAVSSPDVYLMVDRATGSCPGPGGSSLPKSSWSTVKDLVLLPGGYWSQQQDFGEINIATTSQLSAFVQRGLARYPPTADRKYMFIIWDHGSAYFGSGEDDNCDVTQVGQGSTRMCGWLSIPEIGAGLEAGLGAGVLAKFDILAIDACPMANFEFDILAFDACLMANYEVASALKAYTKTLLASEHLEPAEGYDYKAFGQVARNPSATPTQTMLDMDLFGVFEDLLESFATEWKQRLSDSNALSSIFVNALMGSPRVCTDFDAITDLGTLLQKIRDALFSAASDPSSTLSRTLDELTIVDELDALLDAYNKAILLHGTYQADSQLTGLSIFFPTGAAQLTDGQSTVLGSIGATHPQVAAWYNFVVQVFASSAAAQFAAWYNFVVLVFASSAAAQVAAWYNFVVQVFASSAAAQVAAWYNFVVQVFASSAAAQAPYTSLISPDNTFYQTSHVSPTVGADGATGISAQGTIPAPVIVGGDMFFGFKSPLSQKAMVLAGSSSASVGSDNKVLSGEFKGTMYGLQQDILGNEQRNLLYMEEDFLRDSDDVPFQRRLFRTAHQTLNPTP
eukprot:gene5275-18512_t